MEKTLLRYASSSPTKHRMLKQQIDWVDTARSSRCKIPRYANPMATLPAVLGILFGAFVASWPFLITGFFYFASSDAPSWSLLAPFAIFGFVSFPIAAFAFQRSLLLLLGRTEILVDASRIRVFKIAGPFWSTRRCSLSKLGGLRIEDPSYRLPGGCSSLLAIRHDGRRVPVLRSYPTELVEGLAGELARKIERFADHVKPERGRGEKSLSESDESQGYRLQPEFSSPDPLTIQERRTTPIGSNLVSQRRGDDWVIRVPPLGIWKSTSGMGRWWMTGLLLMQLVIAFGLVPALIAGKVQGDPGAGWLVAAVFTALSAAIFLASLYTATRKGAIHVGPTTLAVEESHLFGKHCAEWNWKSIQDVRVAVEEHRDEDGVAWSHFFQIEPDSGEPRKWFGNRSKEELEWLATTVMDELNRRKGSKGKGTGWGKRS